MALWPWGTAKPHSLLAHLGTMTINWTSNAAMGFDISRGVRRTGNQFSGAGPRDESSQQFRRRTTTGRATCPLNQPAVGSAARCAGLVTNLVTPLAPPSPRPANSLAQRRHRSRTQSAALWVSTDFRPCSRGATLPTNEWPKETPGPSRLLRALASPAVSTGRRSHLGHACCHPRRPRSTHPPPGPEKPNGGHHPLLYHRVNVGLEIGAPLLPLTIDLRRSPTLHGAAGARLSSALSSPLSSARAGGLLLLPPHPASLQRRPPADERQRSRHESLTGDRASKPLL